MPSLFTTYVQHMQHLCGFCFLFDRATSKRDSLFSKRFHVFFIFFSIFFFKPIDDGAFFALPYI